MRTALAPDPDGALATWLMHDRGGDVGLKPPAWWAQAACSGMDPDRFVGDTGQPMKTAPEVCARCDVRETCLEYALADPELYSHGVFGGKSPRERRAIGRARGLATSPREVAGQAPCGTKPAYDRHRARGEQCVTCDDARARNRRTPAPCGTPAARRRHRKKGEACAVCEAASARRAAEARVKVNGPEAAEDRPASCACPRSCCPDGCTDVPAPSRTVSHRCKARITRARAKQAAA